MNNLFVSNPYITSGIVEMTSKSKIPTSFVYPDMVGSVPQLAPYCENQVDLSNTHNCNALYKEIFRFANYPDHQYGSKKNTGTMHDPCIYIEALMIFKEDKEYIKQTCNDFKRECERISHRT